MKRWIAFLSVCFCFLLQGSAIALMGEEFIINPSLSAKYGPKAAYDPASQKFLVVYIEAGTGLRGQFLDFNGNRENVVTIATDVICCINGSSSVTYDSQTKRFLVVFVVWDNNTRFDIWGQIVNPDGTLAGPRFAISQAEGYQWYPSVSYSQSSQRFLVVWMDTRVSFNGDVYGQLIGSDGSLIGSEIAINIESGMQHYPVLGYDSENNKFLVVYYDGQISGQFIGTDGSVGVRFNIISGPGCCLNKLGGGVSYDPSGRRFLVAWGTWDGSLIGQLIDSSGSLYRGPFDISQTKRFDFGSVSTLYSNSKFLVVWGDGWNTNGKGDVYAREVGTDGIPLLPRESAVSVGSAWEGVPSVVIGGGGYLVVWEDGRKGSSIYGTLFSGLPYRPMVSLSLNKDNFAPGDPLDLEARIITPPFMSAAPGGMWSFEAAVWAKTPMDFPSDLVSVFNIGGGKSISLPPGNNQVFPLLHLTVPSLPSGEYQFGVRLNHPITRGEFILDEKKFEITAP